MVVGGCGEEGTGAVALMGSISALQDENVLEMDEGGGRTTTGRYLMPLNCIYTPKCLRR